jgi:hypothetical protein
VANLHAAARVSSHMTIVKRPLATLAVTAGLLAAVVPGDLPAQSICAFPDVCAKLWLGSNDALGARRA